MTPGGIIAWTVAICGSAVVVAIAVLIIVSSVQMTRAALRDRA